MNWPLFAGAGTAVGGGNDRQPQEKYATSSKSPRHAIERKGPGEAANINRSPRNAIRKRQNRYRGKPQLGLESLLTIFCSIMPSPLKALHKYEFFTNGSP